MIKKIKRAVAREVTEQFFQIKKREDKNALLNSEDVVKGRLVLSLAEKKLSEFMKIRGVKELSPFTIKDYVKSIISVLIDEESKDYGNISLLCYEPISLTIGF